MLSKQVMTKLPSRVFFLKIEKLAYSYKEKANIAKKPHKTTVF